jgi:hypothetical protein
MTSGRTRRDNGTLGAVVTDITIFRLEVTAGRNPARHVTLFVIQSVDFGIHFFGRNLTDQSALHRDWPNCINEVSRFTDVWQQICER